jgi:hypothetical protein
MDLCSPQIVDFLSRGRPLSNLSFSGYNLCRHKGEKILFIKLHLCKAVVILSVILGGCYSVISGVLFGVIRGCYSEYSSHECYSFGECYSVSYLLSWPQPSLVLFFSRYSLSVLLAWPMLNPIIFYDIHWVYMDLLENNLWTGLKCVDRKNNSITHPGKPAFWDITFAITSAQIEKSSFVVHIPKSYFNGNAVLHATCLLQPIFLVGWN